MQTSAASTKGPDLAPHESRKPDEGAELPQVHSCLDPSASGQRFFGGGMLIGGSNHVKGWGDSQVNYNIAEDSFFFRI